MSEIHAGRNNFSRGISTSWSDKEHMRHPQKAYSGTQSRPKSPKVAQSRLKSPKVAQSRLKSPKVALSRLKSLVYSLYINSKLCKT